MRYSDAAVDEFRNRLSQLGLKTCPVCGSESIGVDMRPAIASVGGTAWPNPTGQFQREPSLDLLYLVRVECEMCGHSLFFNSEKFYTGDDPILLRNA